jgi:hypothetical protein
MVSSKVELRICLFQTLWKVYYFINWFLNSPFIVIFIHVKFVQNLFILENAIIDYNFHWQEWALHPQTCRWSMQRHYLWDSVPVSLFHALLQMFLIVLFQKSLRTMLALESHTVVNQLFILFESFYIIFKVGLFILHLYDLLRQIIVHG